MLALAAALLTWTGAFARASEAPVSTATAVAISSADAVDPLDEAERLYSDAVVRFRSGDEDGGRAELKRAFDAVVDAMEDESLPASMRSDFAAMLDKIRAYQGDDAPEDAAPGLDVALDTSSVRMEALKLDGDNPTAQKFIEIYTKHRPQTVEQALGRSGRYREMIQAALKQGGLPPELFYLVMTESEYNPLAVSRAGAAGLWQFMPGTARKYGLEVSYWIDERYDPEKATKAAVRYLTDLYHWFGDWDLAIAAYNRGEGGLGRDMQFSRSADFDSLSGRKALPEETHLYVPKFTACAIIGAKPEKFGLHPAYEKPEEYDVVTLPRDLDLGVAAKCAGTTETELRRLNPQLRAWCTPKNRSGFALRIPKGTKDVFSAALAQVTDWNPGPTMIRYRVQRGDYLGKIAKVNHTTVRAILETNKLRSARLIHPGMVLLIRPGRSSGHAAGHARRRRTQNAQKS